MWIRSCGMAMTALAPLIFPAAAQTPPGMKQFRDWYVGCDNLRNCSAFGLASEPGAYIKISREGGREARPVVMVVVDVDKAMRITLRFDDPSLAGLPTGPLRSSPSDDESVRVEITEPAAVDRVLGALRKAGKLIAARSGASQANYPAVSEVPLSGAVAALLYMDEQQGRLGTTTALIRRGDKPAAAVPEQPRPPAIAAPKAGTAAIPAKPPAAVLARAKTACGEGNGEAEPSDIQRLNGNLLLYWFTCRDISGAYNFFSTVLVAPADQPQAARAPRFQAPDAFSQLRQQPVSEMLVNASFDEGSMTLVTFAKGRGIGDCGTSTQWVWNGREFALSGYREMPKCSGVLADEWPVLYQAIRK